LASSNQLALGSNGKKRTSDPNRSHKALDTLEDPESWILSYRSQVTRESSIMSLKILTSLVVSTTYPNIKLILFDRTLVNKFILLIARSNNEKESDNVLMKKKESNR